MGCCVARVDGEEPGGGGGGASAVADQGFLIRGQNDPPTGTTDTAIAFMTGATQQLGVVLPSTYVTRTDSATLGTTLKFTQAGVYEAQFWTVLPFGGTSGIMVGLSVDTTAALLLATTNPDPWNASVIGADVWFNWPGAQVAFVHAIGSFTITSAMAANAALGILRAHQTNSAGGAIAAVDTVIADTTIRVRRTGDAA